MSNLLRELQDFNIRILVNDWPDIHPKKGAMLSWKTGNEKALLSFFPFVPNFAASSIVFS